MSNNRALASDIKELDKNITDCESFLAKVLHQKIDSARQVSASKKKNVSSKNAPRQESRERSRTRQRTPSVGRNSVKETSRLSNPNRKPASSIGSSKRISPGPGARPKTSDEGCKRSASVSRLGTQSCTREPPKPSTNKISHHVHIPPAATSKAPAQSFKNQPESIAAVTKLASLDTRNKHQSWGEILQQNHKDSCQLNRGQWDIGRLQWPSTMLLGVPFPSYNTKLPHECKPIRERNSSSECTTAASEKVCFKAPSSKHHPTEESFSSEGTSGFSSNNDLPCNLSNKGIQCGSPIPKARPKSGPPKHHEHRRLSSVSSTSSGASSQKAEEKRVKVEGILGNDVFTMFNPVRTLNFLIKELQGMVNKHPKEDASICRIIADMEKVLHRLPEGGERADTSSGYTTHSQPHDGHSITSGSSHSYDVAPTKLVDPDAEKRAVMKTLEALPALTRRIDERTESMRKKILEAGTHIPVPSFTLGSTETKSDSADNICQLKRHVEISGGQLEIMCRTMEQTCEALKNERDVLKVEMETRDKELRIVKSQEQDFVTTVNSLRNNLESATQRATQLSAENKLLKEQIKVIPLLKDNEEKVAKLTSTINQLEEDKKNFQKRVTELGQEKLKMKGEMQNHLGTVEATKQLTQRLQEVMKERDEAQHELHMLHMECEKLSILSQSKDEELSRFIKDIINIKLMVTTQLNNFKINLPIVSPESPISPLSSYSSDSDEVSSHCQPLCSSPTSTASGLPPVGEDWQEVSTIGPEQTHSSPEILMSAKTKAEETVSPTSEFKSIGRDSYQPSAPSGQGEVCANKGVPSQLRPAIPSSRPPIESTPAVLGDNQWTGATVVTQELQQNVEELFRFINTSSKNEGSKRSAGTSINTVISSTSTRPSAATTATWSSSIPASQTVSKLSRNFRFEMPLLPDPPKFLETPEFSDLSSYHGSLAESSSIESIDAALKELQKDDHKRK